MQVFEELCAVWRGQNLNQDAPQQLVDLAELMQSYGFPTPGWGKGALVGLEEGSPPQVTSCSYISHIREPPNVWCS